MPRLPWVVLAYHAVGDVASEHDPDQLVQPPEKLEWQLGRLVARGYEFVTATEFARRLRAGKALDGACARRAGGATCFLGAD